MRVRGAVWSGGRAEGAPCSAGCSSGDAWGYGGRGQHGVTGMGVTGCGDRVDLCQTAALWGEAGPGAQLKHWKGESGS